MPNPQNLLPPFDSERARECQKKSVEARRRNKTVRETAEQVLEQKVTDPKQLAVIEESGLPIGKKPTYKDFVVASILVQTAHKGSMDDLLKLMDVLGEERDNVDLASLDKAAEILGGVDSAID